MKMVSTTRRLCSAAASAALLLTMARSATAAAASKLDLHLQRQLHRGSNAERVIIRLKPGQNETVRQVLRQRGHAVYADHA